MLYLWKIFKFNNQSIEKKLGMAKKHLALTLCDLIVLPNLTKASFWYFAGSCPFVSSFTIFAKAPSPGCEWQRTVGPDLIWRYWPWGNCRIYQSLFPENNLTRLPNPTYEQCSDFVNFLHQHDFATEVIFQKTLSQSNTEVLFSQRAGRITASNFYKICHLQETSNSKNTVKLLMNYRPLSSDNTPQQLSWGHEKEFVAIKEYIKKCKTKHKGMVVLHSGLSIDKQYPYLGAFPDRIQVCKCCVKILLEVKSIFGKRLL